MSNQTPQRERSAAMTPDIQERLGRYVADLNAGDADAAAEA